MQHIQVPQPQTLAQQVGSSVGSSPAPPIQSHAISPQASSLNEKEENLALATGLVN